MSERDVDVTRILEELNAEPDARRAAAERLLPVVYDQLRRIAEARMREERPGHTLQATALVHEAYAKLVGGAGIAWESRAHFYRTAAEAMRRILIDHARRRNADRRGGGRRRLPLSAVDLAADVDPQTVLDLDAAIDRLAGEDPRAAEVVRLRFFAGLEEETVAEVLGVSRRTVQRDWVFAKARLLQELKEQLDPGAAGSPA